ncbi:hypothetical protein CBR_g39225 [Chara braunii]|uniref:Uncharacterized protein n=1 Tax=Chara braunii TaxID=69332 RepID=A0A388LRG2_CHABU|nr:hypothetical protein CBR_g39225 [Chara braunii]|eukprot:GBG84849.1 hypothetical protein CBR_g39225 [Chara braunii]
MVQAKNEMLSTLPALLRSVGKADDVAVIVASGSPQLSYAELHAEVDRVAAVLRSSFGVAQGSVVSMAFPNTIELVILFLAVTRARAIAAPLNAAYKEEEFRFYMEDAGAACLIIPAKAGGGSAEKAGTTLGIPVVAAEWMTSSESAQALGLKLVSGAVKGESSIDDDDGPGPLPEPDDVALFLHTSGTTSRPKGVPLTHGNLTASMKNIIRTYDLQSTDRTLIVMPLFHVHGLMAALLATLAAGGTVVLPAAGRFSATTFWHDIATYGVTWYTAVPTIHQILLSHHHRSPLVEYPRLRFIRSCSSSLPPPVLHSLEEEFKAPVLEAYAMTEASHQMTSNPLPEHGGHKPGSVGRPTGIELAVIDSDGKMLETGRIGEVCVKGANVTKGYVNNEEANKAAFTGGWFHTGDRGFLDADGYLMLTGRIKELINRGGEKISPSEVDNALLSHPAVSEAVAFAAPDEKYGEVVNAAVVLHPGAVASSKDIIEHCKTKVAPFKVPAHVFITDSVPRTGTGKIQRRFVAEKFLKEAQQQHGPAANPVEASAKSGKDAS